MIWPGSVAIRGRDIVGVGSSAEIAAEWRPVATLDCREHAILPGLINCHVHAGMSLLKSRVGDRPFRRRLREIIWPLAEALTENAAYVGTRLGCLEMMKAGITTLADMWPFPDANAEAVKSTGLRAVLAPLGRTYATGEIEGLASAAQRWNDDRLTPAVGLPPRSEWARETLRSVAAIAQTSGLRIHIDAAEGHEEITKDNGVEEMDALGLLRPGTLLAGCTRVTPQEIDLMVAHGATFSLNPISNAKLGTGIAPVVLVKGRLPVGLGTDSVCSNDRHDLFDEMRMAVLADRGCGAGAALSAQDALALATISGARVLGLEHQIGSLEAGKRADVITVDLDDPRFVPLHRDRPDQVLSHLVFVASCTDVDTVVVDGRVLVRDGNARNLDETELMNQGRDVSRTSLSRAGLA